MNMAAHERTGSTSDLPDALANSAGAQRHSDDALPRGRVAAVPRPGLLTRLSSQFGSRGLTRRGPGLDNAARRELLMHGSAGVATILSMRPQGSDSPAAGNGPGGHEFWVRIELDGGLPFQTRVRQRVSVADQEWMQPGDVVACRVDPGDHHRVVLFVPAADDSARTNIAKILSDGRRAQATVLAATPIAADYSGRDDPVLRLDLELHAWDEPAPWRVRIIAPVPLGALEWVDLGRRLEVAFFTVDRGESVAVDWAASRDPIS